MQRLVSRSVGARAAAATVISASRLVATRNKRSGADAGDDIDFAALLQRVTSGGGGSADATTETHETHTPLRGPHMGSRPSRASAASNAEAPHKIARSRRAVTKPSTPANSDTADAGTTDELIQRLLHSEPVVPEPMHDGPGTAVLPPKPKRGHGRSPQRDKQPKKTTTTTAASKRKPSRGARGGRRARSATKSSKAAVKTSKSTVTKSRRVVKKKTDTPQQRPASLITAGPTATTIRGTPSSALVTAGNTATVKSNPVVAADQPARVLVLVPGFLVLELDGPPPAGYTTPFGRVVVASLDTCSSASARLLHAGDPALCDLIVNPIHKHFGQSPHLMAINVRVE